MGLRIATALLVAAAAGCEARADASPAPGTDRAHAAPNAEQPPPAPSAERAPPPSTDRAHAAPSAEQPPPAPSADGTSTAAAAPCPAGTALVDGRFCIDRWEAITLLEDGATHSPYHAVGARPVRAASRQGVIPQAYISLEEADAACRRAGKRLCTTQQWLDACEGSARVRRRYPYGSKPLRGSCHVAQRFHPTALLHDGRRKTDSWSLNDPRINQLAATVAPTGAFEGCTTPEGVADLHGNLLEWTRGERPLAMGGHYLDGSGNGEGCKYVTSAHDAQYHDFTTGFRCCSRPTAAR